MVIFLTLSFTFSLFSRSTSLILYLQYTYVHTLMHVSPPIYHITAIFLYFILAAAATRYRKASETLGRCEPKLSNVVSHLTTKTITPNWFFGIAAFNGHLVSWRNLWPVNFKCSSIKFTCRFSRMWCFRHKHTNRVFFLESENVFNPKTIRKAHIFTELEKFYPNYLFSSYIDLNGNFARFANFVFSFSRHSFLSFAFRLALVSTQIALYVESRNVRYIWVVKFIVHCRCRICIFVPKHHSTFVVHSLATIQSLVLFSFRSPTISSE